jgi:arylamine N-acetyltransferase
VGYAAPFIEPIPLHMTKDYQLLFGRDRFVVRPGDSLGSYQLLLYRNGTFKHGYTVRPVARKFEDFNEAILNSFKPDSTFFNSLLLTKYTRNSFWILHNLELVESTPRSHAIKNISGLDELESVIHEKFGISPSISRRIITRLDLSADAWN